MSSIPISQVVTINPAVIGTGGNPLCLNGVFVGTNADIPVQSEQAFSFASADDVADYFGETSTEADLAVKYFLGFENSQKKPQTLFFSPFVSESRSAWLRGSSLKGMLLNDAKGIEGDFSISINGTTYSAETIDLSAVTSFTDIATTLQTELSIPAETATVSWDSAFSCFRITTVETGADQVITMPTGVVADALGLSAGTLSAGSAPDSVNSCMNRIKDNSLNWFSFSFVDAGLSEYKEDFAVWVNGQGKRYMFAAWDDAEIAKVNGSACFGNTVKEMKYEGTAPLFNAPQHAAFVMGALASIDWDAENGRITPAFKSQSGLAVSCNNLADATALLANGYSYYGGYAASGDGNTYNFLYNGQLPGSEFKWIDSYANQGFLNSQLQLSIIEFLRSARSVPYNEEGYSNLRLACQAPINQAIRNGSIQRGVAVSETQKAQLIAAVGFDISVDLYTEGYFLEIGEATAQVRGQRKSPPMSLYYMDGGSVQQVTLGSFAIL